jgi:hypothetical protein
MQHSKMFSIQRGSRRKSRRCQHMVIYGSATAKGSRRNKSKTAKSHKREHYQPGDHVLPWREGHWTGGTGGGGGSRSGGGAGGTEETTVCI